MLSIIPVTLIALPIAAGQIVASSRFLRAAALLTIAVREASRGYAPGEGPLSLKMPVEIAPGKGIGGILYELGKISGELEELRGMTFRLTHREATSLGLLAQAAAESLSALPALIDYIELFQERRG